MQLIGRNMDEALYDASVHAYKSPTERWQPPKALGSGAMSPQHRDQFLNETIARYITGSSTNAPSGTRIGAVSSVDRVAAFTTAADIEQPDRLTLRTFADMLYSDEYWRAAFSPVQVAMGERQWEIHNVANPITWQKMGEGGQVRSQRITSEKASYGIDDYATELGFTHIMMSGRRLYQFIDALMLARSSYMQTISEAHYSVLATASTTGTGSQISWQGSSTAPQVDRDIATINAGLSKIAADLKDVVEGLMSARYLLYVEEGIEERAMAAVRARTDQLVQGRQASGGAVPVKRQVMVAPTLSSSVGSGKGLLVFPGRKLQSADDGTALDTYAVKDPKTRNLSRMFWATWGVAAADSRQVVELTFG